tara:strand:- start:491 stop:1672 length:1182 start_codon:yes stop_codon:yes gene_type:complete
MITLYDLLGVSKTASSQVIKTAFKKKALQYHPDKNNGNPDKEEIFKRINTAYQVLSQPQSRANYDFSITPQTVSYPPTAPKKRSNPYKYQSKTSPFRPYVKTEIDWKTNRKSTLYAFGFVFIIALLVVSFVGIRDAYNEKVFFEKLTLRKSIFSQATAFHADGQWDATLSKLSELKGYLLPYEKDMELFEKHIYTELVTQVTQYHQDSSHQKALAHFNLLEKYTPFNEIKLLNWQAQSYRATLQGAAAIRSLEKILLLGHRTVYTYVELAEIYAELMEDSKTALIYYEMANTYAQKYYEAFYGKAYAILLKSTDLPESHYRLYNGLAQAYLNTNNPIQALKATKWNVRVWPEKGDAHLINAKAHLLLDASTLACQQYLIALEKGLQVENIFCN